MSIMDKPPEYIIPYDGAEPVKVDWVPVETPSESLFGLEPDKGTIQAGEPKLAASSRLNRTMKDNRIPWLEFFMGQAKIQATRSTCCSRPTGAVVVKDNRILTTGYNGSMSGAPHCGDGFCYRRSIEAPEEDKYNFCRSVHSEANAVAQAAKLGISLDGADIFCTLAPCYVCLKLLANAGIKRVYYELEYASPDALRDRHWKEVVKESPIEVFQQVTLSSNTLSAMANALFKTTSKRKL